MLIIIQTFHIFWTRQKLLIEVTTGQLERTPRPYQMADSDNFPLLLVVAFAVLFCLTFILSTIGNIWVMVHCWKTLKRSKVSLMWFVLNLASADLLFTFLTFSNALAFLWRWIGGNITCKIQGFLVETAYTVSITNLVMISHQRLTSITDPLNARARNVSNKDYRKIFILWAVGLAICSPLLFLYQFELDETGQAVCGNAGWGYTGKQIFYILHAIFLFVFPLCYMIYSQSKIFRALSSNRIVPSAFSATERSQKTTQKGCQDTSSFNNSVCCVLVSICGHPDSNVFSPS